jgi:hypothetical protein
MKSDAYITICIIGDLNCQTNFNENLLTLQVEDTYEALPIKIQAAFKWIYENYPNTVGVFKTDDDIFFENKNELITKINENILIPYWGLVIDSCISKPISTYQNLLFENTELKLIHPASHYCYGAGYWISNKSIALIAAAKDISYGLEDVTIGSILNEYGIFPINIKINCFERERDNIKPIAYCINLNDKPTNIERIYKDWSKYLDIKRVSARTGGSNGCLLSHLTLFQQFANLDEPYFIVMEDDVYQTLNFSDAIWNKILTFINNKDNNIKWDFITFDPFIGLDKNNFTQYSDMFYKINCFRSMGMVIYNGYFFKNNYKKIPVYAPLDMTMTHNNEFIKLTYKKLLVRQYTDKVSTIFDGDTKHYDEYWDKTEYILDMCNKQFQ